MEYLMIDWTISTRIVFLQMFKLFPCYTSYCASYSVCKISVPLNSMYWFPYIEGHKRCQVQVKKKSGGSHQSTSRQNVQDLVRPCPSTSRRYDQDLVCPGPSTLRKRQRLFLRCKWYEVASQNRGRPKGSKNKRKEPKPPRKGRSSCYLVTYNNMCVLLIICMLQSARTTRGCTDN